MKGHMKRIHWEVRPGLIYDGKVRRHRYRNIKLEASNW